MSKEKRRVPKLRFPGFTEDWEQHKLKSIANMIVAGGDIDKNKIKESGTYPVIANALSKDGIVGYYDDSYRIEAPAVTVTGRGDIGVAKARHQNFTPVVRLLSLTTAHDVDFVEHAINNLKIVSESTGVPQLTVPQLSNYKIHITSIIEERKIGLFISKLDNLITLHQRKLEHLNLKKKALLQKLFPKNGERYPELRFPGFTDAWEQRKFGEIYERSSQKNDSTYGIDKIISVANMYFKIDATVGSEEYLKTYNVFKLGDIAFEGHTNKEYSYGRFVENTIGDGIVSHIFDVFTPRINLDINFWKDLIKYEPIMGPILRRCTKASRMMSNLTSKEFLEEKILCPTLEEQKLIGEFIVRIDKNITLHQRKLEHLQLQKKALLQQMFV